MCPQQCVLVYQDLNTIQVTLLRPAPDNLWDVAFERNKIFNHKFGLVNSEISYPWANFQSTEQLIDENVWMRR